jgi:multiple sugar transport system substrate-binding protein
LAWVADVDRPISQAIVGDQTVQLFCPRLGMLIDSSFQRVNLPKASKFPVRMAPIPTLDGRPGRLPAGGNGLMVLSQDVTRLQAAWRLARFVTEPPVGRIVGENSGTRRPTRVSSRRSASSMRPMSTTRRN